MDRQLFYSWDRQGVEGGAEMKDLLGGKGANLAEMVRIGLPVPPGFTVSTEACRLWQRDRALPAAFWTELRARVERLQRAFGRNFAARPFPLLLSVRSGARASMPGMMDTVLDLGLDPGLVEAMGAATGNPHWAWDCYRRFLQMFGNVVLKVPASRFEEVLTAARAETGAASDSAIPAERLAGVAREFRRRIEVETGHPFPDDPWTQLRMAVEAVFGSWDNPRALSYRRLHHIPDDWGTAVNVQAMVYGNVDDASGSGVGFTRDPGSGENVLYGEYLPNAQGEDVVAGIRTPLPLLEFKGGDASLEARFPRIFDEIRALRDILERHFKDMQDFEFTVEQSKLWVLQTRHGKRSGRAAVRIALDMLDAGLIDERTALLRVDPLLFEQVLHPRLLPGQKLERLAKGLAASPGCAVGRIVLDADEAVEAAKRGPVILVREETDPDDIHGMAVAAGFLTRHGGMTSHAAVVARGMGKPAVVGAGEIRLEPDGVRFGTVRLARGELVTVDGSAGLVYAGAAKVEDAELDAPSRRLLALADSYRTLGVRANADRPESARLAREMGAEGIGLCRTERMFTAKDRLPIVHEMIDHIRDQGRRKACLERLKPFQVKDFESILGAMDGLPVTIRLLDPPLHEFATEKAELKEVNPMLGHRGCRLGITYPEIYEMQVEAVVEATCALIRQGARPIPEIMIPLVGHPGELRRLRTLVEAVVARKAKAEGMTLAIPIGTMVETPRACVDAARIGQLAEFFSFGTNDLTQTTFGYSRDDTGSFLPFYVENGVLPEDPFRVLDTEGVGKLIALAVEGGRSVRPDLEIGICGEHGGDPASIRYFHGAGLNYVSCSPFRVPVARLAAGRAALERPRAIAGPGGAERRNPGAP